MDFSFTEDQTAIRGLAEQIFQDRATDERIAQMWQSDDWYDMDLWGSLASASLLGVGVPEAFGGGGFGLAEACLLLEEQGRTIAPVPLLPALVMAGMPIAEFGSDAQKKALLPGLASGEHLLTAALSEVGVTDPSRPRTTAERDGDAFRLTGEKVCVPIASMARCILVPARIDEDEVGIFLVEPSLPGVELTRQVATNFEPIFHMELRGAAVGADQVLGTPKNGRAIARWIDERASVAACALQLGIAQSALKRTAAYTSERQQFKKPIGGFQAVGQRAADAFIDVEAMRSTLYQALWQLGEDRSAARAVQVAKWWACRGGHRVAHAAQHLHGGIGADVEYPIHRYYLWAKQTEYTLGGASPHLARLGALLASGEA